MDFLNNTDIVVAIGFVIFVGVLIYYGVPGMLARKLDERAVRIRAELDEARALRDEAQTLLASYERRQKEVRAQAEDIVDRRPRRGREGRRGRQGGHPPLGRAPDADRRPSRSPPPSRRRCARSRTAPSPSRSPRPATCCASR